ncbi:MAG: sulfite exporter TauE/SafE family protein [Chlamydiota bacterium]
MEYIIISVSAFAISLLTFYSGFGLGTTLMPVMALFFPLPIAIGLTAVVHLLQNALKTALLWKNIRWKIAAHFGIVALLFAIPGALLLQQLSAISPLLTYSFLSFHLHLSVLHICIGFLLILFGLAEIFPHAIFRVKNLYIGGAMSGFFGGLSGNQGAFRSLFLAHSALDKHSFIGTNAVIATAVDVTRLILYGFAFGRSLNMGEAPLLIVTTAGAVVGVCVGSLLLKKVSIEWIQKIITALLLLLGTLMILGII